MTSGFSGPIRKCCQIHIKNSYVATPEYPNGVAILLFLPRNITIL
ncbi:hypothetical protein CORMATOL_03065 [Corynebacterium matruchotii ATCC 33806]|uniref:Uncharacterized protein n=1 Tax=Corynebacterium matruchotii ATCC 33806 TaxID=566549 RepID=C0E7S4_9CORY|nr:hypothetical protein CORMATOL_03065 [Corynebacterium matruchotii ATCC 33806]